MWLEGYRESGVGGHMFSSGYSESSVRVRGLNQITYTQLNLLLGLGAGMLKNLSVKFEGQKLRDVTTRVLSAPNII